MGVATRLGLFAAALAVVFVAAFGVGRAVAPDDGSPTPDTVPTVTTSPGGSGHDMEMGS